MSKNLSIREAISQANPVKRFAGFGISTIGGGNLGCVVTGNKLYINGLPEKDLSSTELSEFQQYLNDLKDFKQEVKEILEARRNATLQRRQQWRERGRNGDLDLTNNDQQNSTMPDPPQKPSFCTGDATTQYIFDGCKVQNNKVYVGNQYARDLNDQEIDQLKQFDQRMTAYQNQLNANLQKQVQEIFGEDFGRFFGRGTTVSPNQENNDVISSGVTTPATPPLQAPEAPNFCTVIY
uniref:Pepsin inhibitor-3-like repeated domain-containing protein n=1 Tax=Acrobeloides nanus TaxID=290746 RepID=A0A914CFK4_9BILA